MGELGTFEIILIIANVAITYFTLNNQTWFERLVFEIRAVKAGQWYRLLTAGFLHVNWNHLFFNMLTLYFFAGAVEKATGFLFFGLIYFGSLLAGNLLALLIQRHRPHYRAVGASGAVSGVVYAAIALFPGMELGLIFIPGLFFPAWIYGLGFVLYSLYGIRRQGDNIGHEAHLGGAIAGLIISVLIFPELLDQNAMTLVYILVPSVVALVVMIVKPKLLGMAMAKPEDNWSVDDHYREQRANRELELNRILEKIQIQGRSSLTKEEREFLENQQ